ncbi:LOW QUALITY PROTEIN: Integrase, catalytic core protein [Phytophthora megakarya]|uniref:Integrase, catalytic core protein n=1 Tax=Phytophthora megakarya TaxID=4795 RepID=A0A225V9P1_9STRA|nr:LOW QUALITY PROTEIN: Integrase, catalytic core protein [Phytophthora megakarya]
MSYDGKYCSNSSKDWDSHAFGSKMDKKTQGNASGFLKTVKQKCLRRSLTLQMSSGKGHYKSDCPDLLTDDKHEKPNGRRAHSRSTHVQTRSKQAHGNHFDQLKTNRNRIAREYEPSRWYFDTGTNAHIVANKDYFTSFQSMTDSDWNPTVSDFTESGVAQAEDLGSILLATMVDEQLMMVFLEDVLYVPKAGCNLFSPGQALEQGFQISWDQDAKLFGMSKDATEVIRASHVYKLWTFESPNEQDKQSQAINTKASNCKLYGHRWSCGH